MNAFRLACNWRCTQASGLKGFLACLKGCLLCSFKLPCISVWCVQGTRLQHSSQ